MRHNPGSDTLSPSPRPACAKEVAGPAHSQRKGMTWRRDSQETGIIGCRLRSVCYDMERFTLALPARLAASSLASVCGFSCFQRSLLSISQSSVGEDVTDPCYGVLHISRGSPLYVLKDGET